MHLLNVGHTVCGCHAMHGELRGVTFASFGFLLCPLTSHLSHQTTIATNSPLGVVAACMPSATKAEIDADGVVKRALKKYRIMNNECRMMKCSLG